jgi:hypothetical protein
MRTLVQAVRILGASENFDREGGSGIPRRLLPRERETHA